MKSFLGRLALVAAVGGTFGGVASAQDFFASRNDSLLRFDLIGGASLFTLSDTIHSMEFDSGGTLWATSRDESSPGFWTLYQISDPFGTPTLTTINTGIAGVTPSIAWVNGELWGIQTDTGPIQRLVKIDTGTGALTPIGATGETGIAGGGVEFDPATQKMYATNHLPGSLAEIDWDLTGGPDPTGTAIGAFAAPNNNIRSSGLAYYEPTDVLYGLLVDRGGLTPSLYSIDIGTGVETELLDLTAWLGSGAGGTGLAVIPEPGTLAGVALVLLGLVGRRR